MSTGTVEKEDDKNWLDEKKNKSALNLAGRAADDAVGAETGSFLLNDPETDK